MFFFVGFFFCLAAGVPQTMAKFEVLCLPPVISWEEIQCGWASLCSSLFLSRRWLRGHSALHVPSVHFPTNYRPGLFYLFSLQLLCNSLLKWRKHFPVCNIPNFEGISREQSRWRRLPARERRDAGNSPRRRSSSAHRQQLSSRRCSTSASLLLPKASRFSPAASKRDFSNYLGVSL